MTETILVVDDQSNVRKLLQDYLNGQGYRVALANDGQNALFVARHEHPDLVLLDIMMPNMDGYQFLRAYRKVSQTPVIVISARTGEDDAVQGLDLGADDYVTKPFRMRELVARIRAALRRQELPDDAEATLILLRVGEIELDQAGHRVAAAGRPVTLTPIEFDLLSILMRSPGRVFTRSELVERLSESGFTGLESTLNVHVRNLRSKIEANPSNPVYIVTVFGVGYRIRKDRQT